MLLAASIADGLIFLVLVLETSPSAELGVTVTARVDWAVWTVQMGFVVSVVMDPVAALAGSTAASSEGSPATKPAMMPSAVDSA